MPVHTALPQQKLEVLLDAAVREVTEQLSGVCLSPGGEPPGEDLCTVFIAFRRGFHSSLSLRADTAVLTRIAQGAMGAEAITPQDLEDFIKEYFNVLCGHIAAVLYRNTKIAARLTVPLFHRGPYEPEGCQRQFVLNFSDERSQSAQLIHYVPDSEPGERAVFTTV